MRAAFQKTILFCISKNLSFGVWEQEELIGFILCFDYKEVRDNEQDKFNAIFARKDKASAAQHDDVLHSLVEKLPGSVIYCLS